ncbi:LAETG motif-containing sortase-dependent surface protein [Kitasatospora purpeofusca]|uniref:LAETG motif-containing sortase-dependent surface protein n=1 Tax=Kitasatospora purpeofusca TaxID=67352 RepID=UPI00368029D1
MRTSRLLAASTLIALSFGATVGTATAGAAAVSPAPSTAAPTTAAPTTAAPTGSPSGTGTPSAPTSPNASTSPSAPASPSASASPSATATKPPTTPTQHPTVPPSLFPTTAPGFDCSGGVYQGFDWLKATGTGLWEGSGAPGSTQDVSVTWENLSGVDLPTFRTYLYLTDTHPEDDGRPVAWSKDFFTVQYRVPGQDWKSGVLDDRYLSTGQFKLAKGEKLTLQFRVTPTDKAPLGSYWGNFGGGGDAMDNSTLPHPARDDKKGCTQYINYYEGTFKLAKAGTATTGTPSSSGSPKAASPSAVSGPHLADTGSSSNTLPIAVGGAAVLAAGAGTLLVLRRRRTGSHS